MPTCAQVLRAIAAVSHRAVATPALSLEAEVEASQAQLLAMSAGGAAVGAMDQYEAAEEEEGEGVEERFGMEAGGFFRDGPEGAETGGSGFYGYGGGGYGGGGYGGGGYGGGGYGGGAHSTYPAFDGGGGGKSGDRGESHWCGEEGGEEEEEEGEGMRYDDGELPASQPMDEWRGEDDEEEGEEEAEEEEEEGEEEAEEDEEEGEMEVEAKEAAELSTGGRQLPQFDGSADDVVMETDDEAAVMAEEAAAVEEDMAAAAAIEEVDEAVQGIRRRGVGVDGVYWHEDVELPSSEEEEEEGEVAGAREGPQLLALPSEDDDEDDDEDKEDEKDDEDVAMASSARSALPPPKRPRHVAFADQDRDETARAASGGAVALADVGTLETSRELAAPSPDSARSSAASDATEGQPSSPRLAPQPRASPRRRAQPHASPRSPYGASADARHGVPPGSAPSASSAASAAQRTTPGATPGAASGATQGRPAAPRYASPPRLPSPRPLSPKYDGNSVRAVLGAGLRSESALRRPLARRVSPRLPSAARRVSRASSFGALSLSERRGGRLACHRWKGARRSSFVSRAPRYPRPLTTASPAGPAAGPTTATTRTMGATPR